MDSLHAEHPYLLNYPIQVRIKKSDEESGHGIGAIKIAERVSIPIIVESNQLQPLDVFMDKEGQIKTMTRLTLEEALQSQDVGTPIRPKASGAASDSAMGHNVLPPYDGKYAFASAVEATLEDLSEIFEGLEPQLQKNASAHHVIQELARPIQMEKQASTRDAEVISKVSGSTKITEMGLYKVATDQGVLTGVVTDKTVSLTTGSLLEDINAFIGIGKEAKYANSRGAIYGSVALDGKVTTAPETGRGVYMLMKEGTLLTTEPVTLRADVNVDDDTLWGCTDAGHTRRIEKVAELDEDIISAGDTVYLSEDWKFVQVSGQVKLAETQVLAREGAIVDITRVGNSVRVSEPHLLGLDKLAANEGITAEKLTESLVTTFGESIAAATLKKIASEHAATLLLEEEDAVESMDPALVPTLSDEELDALSKVAVLITPELLKEAKVQSEYTEQTIDAVLGLHFLSPENVHKFMEALPALEEAQQVIAKLLLASRLGLATESRPLRTAMFALDAITRDLRELRNQALVR